MTFSVRLPSDTPSLVRLGPDVAFALYFTFQRWSGFGKKEMNPNASLWKPKFEVRITIFATVTIEVSMPTPFALLLSICTCMP